MNELQMIKSPMPTVEEILAGETQGGVPRPPSAAVLDEVHVLESRGGEPEEPKRTRWSAIKQLFRVIIWGE